jgi:hypothetical protein
MWNLNLKGKIQLYCKRGTIWDWRANEIEEVERVMGVNVIKVTFNEHMYLCRTE